MLTSCCKSRCAALLLEFHDHVSHGTEGAPCSSASAWTAKLAGLPVSCKSESMDFADCPAQDGGTQTLQAIKSPVVMAAPAASK